MNRSMKKRYAKGFLALVFSVTVLFSAIGCGKETDTESSSVPSPFFTSEIETQQSTETESEVKTGTETETQMETERLNPSESESVTESESTTESEPETSVEPESETETSTETELETESSPETESETELESVAETESESATEPEPQARHPESDQLRFPCIYITTADGARPTSKEVYLDCKVDVENTVNSDLSACAAQIRVRGNSTAENQTQPPLKLKFAEKQNLVDLHGGKSFRTWVLLKPPATLVPDYLALKMGNTILGSDNYCSDAAFVNLFVNGEPWGIRIACEQNQIKKNRVNVTEAKSASQAPNTFGYYFELDRYASQDSAPYFTLNHDATGTLKDMNGANVSVTRLTYSVKNDIISSEQNAFLGAYLNGVWKVLYEATYHGKAFLLSDDAMLSETDTVTPEEAVRRVLNVESAVNMYILYECFYDFDQGAGSFYFAKDFSPDAQYDKVSFVSPWDFNYSQSASNLVKGLHAGAKNTSGSSADSENPWFIALMANDWFRAQVCARWKQIGASNLTAICNQTTEVLTKLKSDARYGNDLSKVTKASDFVNFTVRRINWLNTQFK